MFTNNIKSILAMVAILGGLVTTAFAQDPEYHLKLVYDSQPTGPNEIFYVDLVLEEHDVDVISYQLRIGFDSTRGDYTALQDNTGQGGMTGAIFSRGPYQLPLDGVPYADVYRIAMMDSIFSTLPPENPDDPYLLGRIQFTTSADYNPDDGPFGVYLGSDGTAGGVFYGFDVERLHNVTYISLAPTSSVMDWAMY